MRRPAMLMRCCFCVLACMTIGGRCMTGHVSVMILAMCNLLLCARRARLLSSMFWLLRLLGLDLIRPTDIVLLGVG